MTEIKRLKLEDTKNFAKVKMFFETCIQYEAMVINRKENVLETLISYLNTLDDETNNSVVETLEQGFFKVLCEKGIMCDDRFKYRARELYNMTLRNIIDEIFGYKILFYYFEEGKFPSPIKLKK